MTGVSSREDLAISLENMSIATVCIANGHSLQDWVKAGYK